MAPANKKRSPYWEYLDWIILLENTMPPIITIKVTANKKSR